MNITTFSIPKSSKIYQNWDFCFENIPSGNPESVCMDSGTSARKSFE
jgi:hypothetical protein